MPVVKDASGKGFQKQKRHLARSANAFFAVFIAPVPTKPDFIPTKSDLVQIKSDLIIDKVRPGRPLGQALWRLSPT